MNASTPTASRAAARVDCRWRNSSRAMGATSRRWTCGERSRQAHRSSHPDGICSVVAKCLITITKAKQRKHAVPRKIGAWLPFVLGDVEIAGRSPFCSESGHSSGCRISFSISDVAMLALRGRRCYAWQCEAEGGESRRDSR
jgi:hypothetical protein